MKNSIKVGHLAVMPEEKILIRLYILARPKTEIYCYYFLIVLGNDDAKQ